MASSGWAQELEPRAYSPAPVGTHYLLVSYTRLGGDVLTDPSLPITDVQARIDLVSLAYVQVFDLFGRTASVGVVLPYSRGHVSGNISGNISGNAPDAPDSLYRAGIGDAALRLAVNLVGGPARAPEAFFADPPGTTVGASVTVVAPTGQYHPDRLVNIGANRWAIKPELGISWPWGNWFAEGSAGVWFYTTNDAFLGGRERSQRPLGVLQLHGGYQFRQGLWLAADVGFYSGGQTAVNGVDGADRRSNTRYGLTLSVPLARAWSARVSASRGWITRTGGDYRSIALTIQYRWID